MSPIENKFNCKFSVGDKIFAKVKGYPYWPAIITGIENDLKKMPKYNIKFYGTHETSLVSQDNICYYQENKNKYGVEKTNNFKNKKFNNALKEAEFQLLNFNPNSTDEILQNEMKFGDLGVEEVLQKVKNYEQQEGDLETSLSLAAEVGNSLLTANSTLNQKIHELRNEISNLNSIILNLKKENSEIITESEEELKVREDMVKSLREKNNNLEQEVDFLNRKVTREISLKEELIKMEEQQKNHFKNQISSLNIIKSTLTTKIKTLEQELQNLKNNLELNKNTSVNMEACLPLLNNHWIFDDSISMYFDLLVKSKMAGNVCFLTPALSQAVKYSDNLDSIIITLNLSNQSYIFIPINDAERETSGCHWSLLLYSKTEKTFFYFDSYNNLNLQHARAIFSKLKPYVCTSNHDDICLRIIDCPQQRNGVDCGIYLIIFVDKLINSILANPINLETVITNYMNNKITDGEIIKKRALLSYLSYNKQYIQLTKETIKDLIFNGIENNSKDSQCQVRSNRQVIVNPTEIAIIQEQVYTEKQNPQSCARIGKSNKHSATDNCIIQDKFPAARKNQNYWTKVQTNKSRLNPSPTRFRTSLNRSVIPTKNKYDILDRCEDESIQNPHFNSSVYHNKKYKINKNKPKVTKEVPHPQITISLSSDSQGRYVRNKIEEISDGKIKVFSFVRANTTLIQIVDLALKEKDNKPLILLGGTNDSLKNNLNEVYEKLESKLDLLSRRRPIFITTIPNRYDQPMKLHINGDIDKLNNYIAELVNRMSNVFLIDLSKLQRFHFTQHGLHLHKRGKSKLAQLIIDAIARQYNKNGTFLKLQQSKSDSSAKLKTSNLIQRKSTYKNTNHSNHTGKQSKFSEDSKNKKAVSKEPTIRTIKADMKYVIDNYSKYKDIAFAHCISADFGSHKQMTEGVAVVFKNKFGKPLKSDSVNELLAYQNTKEGAGVYSLITKPNYYKKPQIATYNAAFKELAEHFKIRRYKHLICSPMGCVRDLIRVEDFIKNLITFQSNTAANISIVVHNETAERSLRNGLSYDEFMKKIWSTIATEIGSKTSRFNEEATCLESQENRCPHPARVPTNPQTDHRAVVDDLEEPQQPTSIEAFPPLTTSMNRVKHVDYIMDCPNLENSYNLDNSLDATPKSKDADSSSFL